MRRLRKWLVFGGVVFFVCGAAAASIFLAAARQPSDVLRSGTTVRDLESRMTVENGHVVFERPAFTCREQRFANDLMKDPFWHAVGTAVRRGNAKCLVAVRSDTPYESLNFVTPPPPCELQRIKERGKALELLDRLVSAGATPAVERPQNGFTRLKVLLCNELEAKGLLPVEMTMAFAALRTLSDRLTPGAYRRLRRRLRNVDGVTALIAADLDRSLTALAEDLRVAAGKGRFEAAEARQRLMRLFQELADAEPAGGTLSSSRRCSRRRSDGPWPLVSYRLSPRCQDGSRKHRRSSAASRRC